MNFEGTLCGDGLYSNILFVAISENHPRPDDPWREFDEEKYKFTRYTVYPQELF